MSDEKKMWDGEVGNVYVLPGLPVESCNTHGLQHVMSPRLKAGDTGLCVKCGKEALRGNQPMPQLLLDKHGRG